MKAKDRASTPQAMVITLLPGNAYGSWNGEKKEGKCREGEYTGDPSLVWSKGEARGREKHPRWRGMV